MAGLMAACMPDVAQVASTQLVPAHREHNVIAAYSLSNQSVQEAIEGFMNNEATSEKHTHKKKGPTSLSTGEYIPSSQCPTLPAEVIRHF